MADTQETIRIVEVRTTDVEEEELFKDPNEAALAFYSMLFFMVSFTFESFQFHPAALMSPLSTS